MFRFIAVLLLGLGFVVQADVPAESVEDVIEAEMSAAGVPGLAYAVVTDGEITSIGAHGLLKKGEDRPVTPDTPFVIGSISKSFTAVAVLQLVEAGQVDLDTEVSRYLEVFSGRPAGEITIRQLLGHTSGFSTVQGNTSHTEATGEIDELARQVDGLAAVTPAYQPGDRWAYSNANYQVLGRLIEAVSGEEYQTYVTANILEPIGMEHSFVADGATHDDMATGHTSWFGTKRPRAENTTHRATAPQGGIVASAGDLARYLQMLMNGEDDVLSADSKALMMRPAGGGVPHYGFGWYLDDTDQTVWHAGATPGIETLATMIPTQNSAVVVLVNGGSGLGFGETAQLRSGITARALDLDYDGEGSRWAQKMLFVSLALLPVVYLLSMVGAWRYRAGLRAKSGAFGLFSWWFPLLTTVVSAVVLLWLVPNLFGAPLGTITLFQPDLGLALIATAVAGVVWAVFRLGVAYTGRSDPA